MTRAGVRSERTSKTTCQTVASINFRLCTQVFVVTASASQTGRHALRTIRYRERCVHARKKEATLLVPSFFSFSRVLRNSCVASLLTFFILFAQPYARQWTDSRLFVPFALHRSGDTASFCLFNLSITERGRERVESLISSEIFKNNIPWPWQRIECFFARNWQGYIAVINLSEESC